MGRKPNPLTPLAPPPALNAEALAEVSASTNALAAHSSEMAKRFDSGRPYNRDRVVSEAELLFSQSAELMLEGGRRLILLKENEPHGAFTEIVEGVLGMASRTARLIMSATLKFTSPALESKRPALAVLGKTKLFELITEADEDLMTLADGGTLLGKTLDDFDRMTTREMKDALRKARQDKQEEHTATQQAIKARDADINTKQATIDRLQRELAGKPAAPEPTPALREVAALEALSRAAFAAVATVEAGLRKHFIDLEKLFEPDYPPNHVRLAQQQALTQVMQAARCLAGEFGVYLPGGDAELPQELSWMAGLEAAEREAATLSDTAVTDVEVIEQGKEGRDVE